MVVVMVTADYKFTVSLISQSSMIEPSYFSGYGAKPIQEFLPALSKEAAFRKAVIQVLKDASSLALDAFAEGRFPEPISDNFVEDIVDDLFCEKGEVCLTLYAPGGPELGPFPINIMNFAGIFWVSPLEGDKIGFFRTQEEAVSCARGNWDSLTEDEDDPALWE
jgi:hypothetical protein